MVFSMGLMCGVLDFSMWKSVDRGQQYCFGGKFIDSLLLKYWFLFLFHFSCGCVLDGGCKWFCLPLYVWCCVVWWQWRYNCAWSVF